MIKFKLSVTLKTNRSCQNYLETPKWNFKFQDELRVAWIEQEQLCCHQGQIFAPEGEEFGTLVVFCRYVQLCLVFRKPVDFLNFGILAFKKNLSRHNLKGKKFLGLVEEARGIIADLLEFFVEFEFGNDGWMFICGESG